MCSKLQSLTEVAEKYSLILSFIFKGRDRKNRILTEINVLFINVIATYMYKLRNFLIDRTFRQTVCLLFYFKNIFSFKAR